jgi:hypothetical protein
VILKHPPGSPMTLGNMRELGVTWADGDGSTAGICCDVMLVLAGI